MASFLMGANGRSFFAFTRSRDRAGVLGTNLAYRMPKGIGSPSGAMQRRSSGAYVRNFANGASVVNPTDRTVTVGLGSSMRRLNGSWTSSLTLAPHSGDVLTKTGTTGTPRGTPRLPVGRYAGRSRTTGKLRLSGKARDNVAVKTVRVAIRNEATGKWRRANGRWGKHRTHAVSLRAPGRRSTSLVAWLRSAPGPVRRQPGRDRPRREPVAAQAVAGLPGALSRARPVHRPSGADRLTGRDDGRDNCGVSPSVGGRSPPPAGARACPEHQHALLLPACVAAVALVGLVGATVDRWVPPRLSWVNADNLAILAEVAAAVCCWVAGLRGRGRLRACWWLLGAMVALYAAGDVLWVVLANAAGTPPLLSVADSLYLVALVPGALGLVLYPVTRGWRSALGPVLLDVAVLGSSVILASQVFVFREVLDAVSAGDAFILLVYPVTDLLLACLVLILMLRSVGDPRLDVVLLGLTFLTYALADNGYALAFVRGTDQTEGLVAAAYLAAPLFLAAAALASVASSRESRRLEQRISATWPVVLPDLAALAALAVSVVWWLEDTVSGSAGRGRAGPHRCPPGLQHQSGPPLALRARAADRGAHRRDRGDHRAAPRAGRDEVRLPERGEPRAPHAPDRHPQLAGAARGRRRRRAHLARQPGGGDRPAWHPAALPHRGRHRRPGAVPDGRLRHHTRATGAARAVRRAGGRARARGPRARDRPRASTAVPSWRGATATA